MTAAILRIVASVHTPDGVRSGPRAMAIAMRDVLLRTSFLWWPAYLAAGLCLLTAIVVAPMTGHSLDISGVSSVMGELSDLLILALLGLLGIRFVAIARARPPEGPTRALGRWLLELATGQDRWAHIAHTLIVVSAFALSFGLLKGAIALLVPFHWDAAFIEADRVLHGGVLPHEWLGPLLASPMALLALNFLYNLWYFIVLGALVLAGVQVGRPGAAGRHHMRFAVSFILTWLIGGFFMATFFSSAGPCFAGLAGISTEYDGLMAALRAANETATLWALETQDMLWRGHTGERDGSLGISAFPSMHVATSVLLAIYVQRFGRTAAWAGWLYAAAIMLGSVALAWHYAVDGYASLFVAWGIWWAVGKVLPTGSK